MEKLKEKIKEIANTLTNLDESYLKQYGLLSGTSGIACFLIEYGKFTNEKSYTEAGMKMIERTFDLVMQNDPYHTHCAGLAGVAHYLIDLEDDGLLKNSISKDIDTYLELSLQQEINNDHYDFLHGAIGISYYFIHRAEKKKKHQRIVRHTIKYLDKTAERYSKKGVKYIKWKSYDFQTGDPCYNISLSHGIASIIGVLVHIYNANYTVNRKKVAELIEGAVNYILAQQIDKDKYGSYFPYTSIESAKEISTSRLAWCYGDLGIASVLWQAGKTLENDKWVSLAEEIFIFSAQRREPSETLVVDAGLCHGTAGIAHIFNRIYRNTGIKELKESTDFWVNETLQMANFEDGLAGFKTYHGTENVQWINDPNLLEGICGIGLGLMSSISSDEPKWDKHLLLS